MTSMTSRDAFGGVLIAGFSVKNIPVVVAAMICPPLIETSFFQCFSPVKTTHLCITFFHHNILDFKIYSLKFVDLWVVVAPWLVLYARL